MDPRALRSSTGRWEKEKSEKENEKEANPVGSWMGAGGQIFVDFGGAAPLTMNRRTEPETKK